MVPNIIDLWSHFWLASLKYTKAVSLQVSEWAEKEGNSTEMIPIEICAAT